MRAERRAQLRRKYLELGVGELVAAAAFVAVAATVVMPRMDDSHDHFALWLARTWVVLRPMPSTTARVYRAFRAGDAVLLVAGLGGVVLWWPDSFGSALVVMAVWGFGAVEYINYFLVRLAYPVLRWFTAVRQGRLPQLARDLRAAKQ